MTTIEEGEKLFAQGKIEEAERCFLEILDRDPNNLEAFNNLGVIEFEKGDLGKAKGYFLKALEIDPSHQDALYNLDTLIDMETKRAHSEGSIAAHGRLTNSRIAIVNTFDNKFNEIYASYFSRENEVQIIRPKTEDDLLSAAEWADIVWCTWCNEPLIYLSHNRISSVLVTHIRSYEVLTPGLMKGVQWQNIDAAIFVADHVREVANRVWCQELSIVPQTTVHNCVELGRYPFYENGPGGNICYVGYLNHKKGIGLLLQCIREAVDLDKSFRFHVAGDFQETRFEIYMKHLIEEMGLTDHVIFYGWVNDVPAFLKDMNFVISTSPWEGCPNNIIEAMACGIKPVIHNWRGAKQLFPKELVFNTVDEFCSIISSKAYKSKAYRAYVNKNFDAQYLLPKIDSFLVELMEKRRGDQKVNKALKTGAQHSLHHQVSTSERRPSKANVDMIRLGWVPFGNRDTASSRLRVFKIHEHLNRNSQHYRRYQSEIVNKLEPSMPYDVLILQRVYGKERFNDLLQQYRKQGIKVVLDLCDLYPEAMNTAESVDLVTTNNEVRMRQLKEMGFRCKFRTVDDALDYDIDRCHPHPHFEELRAVWFGTYSNVHLTKTLSAVVRATAITSPNVKSQIPSNWQFLEWNYDNFVEQLQQFSVCLLPQEDDGKSANKMLTAILCGLPVIASDIFSYRRVARLAGIEEFLCKEAEDWARAIEVLGIRERRLEYLEKSQQILLQNYCMEAVVRQWTEAFDELLSLGSNHGGHQKIPKDQLTKAKRTPPASKSKINLGCGNEYLSGYLNVDIGSELADLRADILDLDLERESVDEVLMVHVIEHVDYLQVRPLLDRIYSWLKTNGKLVMEFPDVNKVAHCILEIKDNPEELQRSPFGIRGFYGEPTQNMSVHDYHKWGWSETTMAPLLRDLGFRRIDAERPQHHGSREKRDTRLVAVK